ncbi:AfsR/SARP family transcriptional regulator [Amycolatopsis thailandensis]|uniref:AfsR/SARP family transcriptional regulator n=1 Tax=Amycolatopsis thailandensis TaxID=589330 RepID=UPI00142D87E9|nr:AfsR/SARP family transcriptional regulator [Amycolatopsis thailandensis]
MRIALLGPLEVQYDGRPIAPSAPKQRTLLALLLLNANHEVSVGQCARELGDGASRKCSVSTVHTHILQLRKALGPAAKRLRTTGAGPDAGYLFATEPMELDLDRFDKLVGIARTRRADGNLGDAARLITEALNLWRTEALVDVKTGPGAQRTLVGLRTKRMEALVICADLALRLGHHRQVLGKLTALVHRHPAEEQLTAHLMTALYRSGRQGDALAVYQRFLTSAETSSRALSELQTAILLADPVLEGPAMTPSDLISAG